MDISGNFVTTDLSNSEVNTTVVDLSLAIVDISAAAVPAAAAAVPAAAALSPSNISNKNADTRSITWQDNDEENSIVEVAPPTEFISDKLDKLDTVRIRVVKHNDRELVRLIRSLPGLTSLQTRIIELRYCSLLASYRSRLFFIDLFYHTSRTFISLGSVAVPAMLSIQSPTSPSSSTILYWATWTISLMVTILHNLTTIFRFDKKFFGIHTVYERLVSEGWQYMELSGRYSGHFGNCIPTHANQFLYFMNSIEHIKLKQIQDEFNAAADAEKPAQKQSPPDSSAKQAAPSPLDLTRNGTTK